MSWFFATNSSINNLFLRVGLGALMLPHGIQKTIGSLGPIHGPGFMDTMNKMAVLVHNQSAAIPMFVCKGLAVLAILAESVGALALILGFFTRLAAFGIFMVMAGAIWMVHGSQGLSGFEYNLLIMLVSFVLMFGGGGLASIDRAISKNQI